LSIITFPVDPAGRAATSLRLAAVAEDADAAAPLITIGVPVFNGEEYLREAIDSILAQSFTDFELIISDNASTDTTPAICREYATRDNRVRYIRNAVNIGGPANFNALVQAARGTYFKWVAHDDKLMPTFLEECVERFDDHEECVLVYSLARCIDADGNVLHNYERAMLDGTWSAQTTGRFQRLIKEAAYNHSITVPVYLFGLIRTADLRKTNLLRPYISSDNNLLAELALRGRFTQVDDYLSLIRYHPGSSGWIPAWSAKRLQAFFRPHGATYLQQVLGLGWRHLVEYYPSILHSEAGWGEKGVMCIDATWGILLRAFAHFKLANRQIRYAGAIVKPWQRY
jgi:glycosyltransferase involved in cell wall biosynthesis